MAFTINDFKEGDKVYHLSNPSTIMVVNAVNPNLNEVTCEWFLSGQIQERSFKPASLAKDNPGPFIRTVVNLP